MKKSIYVLLLSFSVNCFAQYSNSFLVEIDERKISVTSPKNKTQIVSIVVTNKTLDSIISEIRSGDKVIKRFTLKESGKEVIQVDASRAENLTYTPIAPAFESVDLIFSKGQYEVPEKK